MVRADRPVKTYVYKSFDDLIHVKASVGREVCRFLKIRPRVELKIPDMRKMYSAFKGTDHVRQIVVRIRSIGTRTECHTVMRVIDHLHHPEDIFLAGDDARKPENRPCRIIRVNCHVDVIFVTDRHDPLEKIFQVLKQLLLVDALIFFKKLLYMCEALRLPARHYRAVRIVVDRIEKLLRIQGVNCFLRIRKYGRPVRALSRKLRPRPVKHRHEVVADHVNIFPAEVRKCLDVIVNQPVTVRSCILDLVRDIDGLDAGNMKARRLYFFLQRVNFLLRPDLSRLCVIQRRDNAFHSRNLPNLLQRDGVIF